MTAWNTRAPIREPVVTDAQVDAAWNACVRKDGLMFPSIEFWNKSELRVALEAAGKARSK